MSSEPEQITYDDVQNFYRQNIRQQRNARRFGWIKSALEIVVSAAIRALIK